MSMLCIDEEEISRIEDEKLRPTVTYIQNNVKKTLILDGSNRLEVEHEIYAETEMGVYISRGEIKDDISWIHFKNFNFKFKLDSSYFCSHFAGNDDWLTITGGVMPICHISCHRNTVCILENCEFFDRKGPVGDRLKLIGGSFHLFHTYLGDFNTIYTNATDFDLVSGNFSGPIKVECEGGNVSIHDCDTIDSLEVHSVKKLALENKFNLRNFCVNDVEELVIGSNQLPTTMVIWKKSSSICPNKLVFNNCKLTCYGELDINCSVIDGKDYTLTGSELIINQIRYGKNAILTDTSQNKIAKKTIINC